MADVSALAGATSSLNEFATAFNNSNLHLIILPTEQCNFRCTYCYEDFAVGRMKPPVVAGIKRLLEQRIHTLHQLHIAWFGGEPLIALSVVEDISGFAHCLAQQVPGLHYSGEMTTNAYRLGLATAERLHAQGITHYQITLDGPEHIHDRTRVQLNGKGSFQQIWGNLLDIRSSSLPVTVNLRVHIMRSNLSVMPEFLREIRDTFLGDTRFTILLKAVGRWGGPHDQEIAVLEGPERTEVLEKLKSIVLQGPRSNAHYQAGSVCYAARPNSLVIRATGDVGKCTVALSDPANSIGHLLPDGTLHLRSEALRPWLRGWGNKNLDDALGCPLVGLPRDGAEPVLQIGVRPNSRPPTLAKPNDARSDC